MNVYDWLPLANLILGLVGLAWLVARCALRWSEYPTEMRMILGALMGFVFVLIEMSAEQIYNDAPALGLNVIFITVVKIGLLIVLWQTRSALFRTGVRHPGNGDSDDPNRDITL